MITTRRAVISLILAGCLTMLVWSFTKVRPTTNAVIFKNPAVVTVSPLPGALVLRQSSVAITLAPGYTLALDTADGLSISTNGATTGIPQDELQILPGQNAYQYLPASGRTFSELPAGRVCAVAQIRKVSNPADTGQPFSWCFQTQ